MALDSVAIIVGQAGNLCRPLGSWPDVQIGEEQSSCKTKGGSADLDCR